MFKKKGTYGRNKLTEKEMSFYVKINQSIDKSMIENCCFSFKLLLLFPFKFNNKQIFFWAKQNNSSLNEWLVGWLVVFVDWSSLSIASLSSSFTTIVFYSSLKLNRMVVVIIILDSRESSSHIQCNLFTFQFKYKLSILLLL